MLDTEDALEKAYWDFDSTRAGTGPWKGRPKSERDAFKGIVRAALQHQKDSDLIKALGDYYIPQLKFSMKGCDHIILGLITPL
ncbi:hypothetical protein J2Y45_001533 [Dyadobacter sp. BE34]|uniref:Uncharacterized protein n=1 Tax=Dyadobacter fermentans TaxID=94254 RepID=A0ABU1QUB8_9BACT|nr:MULTISPECIES: hypothetical protein [Dyadobacter]MDR6804264.1 hypothetical protein [Dyadobacter fermentans]MDR7042004.1 hypothetical protein [Dyadobacter sp. BE242]MDR7196407.1 hypothetical protein [Dyadobacter sp. BE34]MDR7213048.1 hypothetical protein [Dyadobacter sp. BE31]MDR7261813.1 hypothetical protein [Dyadobacter sp. BE32]